MREIDLLTHVLDRTGDIIERVTPDQLGRPTPCPDYDVAAMVRHLVGWVRSFEAAAQGGTFEGDPSKVEVSDDPAAQFRAAAAGIVAGWRVNGFDRTLSITGGDGQPAELVFNVTVMEYMTHGWDLAVATGQPVPFGDDEAEDVLRRAEAAGPAAGE